MTDSAQRFSIRFDEISGLVPPESWAESATAAKRIAFDAINSGAAKRAEIRDAGGNLILTYPDEFSTD